MTERAFFGSVSLTFARIVLRDVGLNSDSSCINPTIRMDV